MRTFVTTFSAKSHLATFLRLMDKFYPVDIVVNSGQPTEAKSDQLRRLLESIHDEYLILLEDDFYFLRPVDLQLLQRVCNFCVEKKVDRFSLQSKNAHSFTDWPQAHERVGEHQVYRANPQVQISFSLEASVWKRSYLLSHLRAGQSDANIEIEVSNQVRFTNHKTYALDVLVMEYCDGMRRGETVIHLQDDPLRLVGKGLEPWCGDLGVVLL
jgi:hypothetical protein